MTASDRLRALLLSAAVAAWTDWRGDPDCADDDMIDRIVDAQMRVFESVHEDRPNPIVGWYPPLGAYRLVARTPLDPPAVTDSDQSPVSPERERVFDELVALGQELSEGQASLADPCSERWACAECHCDLPGGHAGDHERMCRGIRCGPYG